MGIAALPQTRRVPLDALLGVLSPLSTHSLESSSGNKRDVETSRVSDAELLEGIRRGDMQAHRAVVERYQRLLYSIAYGMLGDHAEADDAVQEVFIRFFRKADKVRDAEALKSYLARSTTNECIDRLRRAKRRPLVSLEGSGISWTLAEPAGRTPEDRMRRKELEALIRWALDQLSLRQRRVIVLSLTEGLSYAEIAKVLGCEEVTVRTHLHRARKRLQELLGPRLRDLEAGFVRKKKE